MLDKLLVKLRGYSPQQTESPRQSEEQEPLGERPEKLVEQEPVVSQEDSATEPTTWGFAWVFPGEVYYCTMEDASDRLNQLVAVYADRAVQESDQVVGYCTFGEVDLLSLSIGELVSLHKRFIQCSLPLASARLLWQYGLLNLENAIKVQQGKLEAFPPALAEQIKGVRMPDEGMPHEAAVPLTKQRIFDYIRTGVGQEGLCEALSRLADPSTVRQVTLWFFELDPEKDIHRALPLVERLATCPAAKTLMPDAVGKQALAEAIAQLSVDEINPLMNLYCTAYLVELQAEQKVIELERNWVSEQLSRLQHLLDVQARPLWAIEKLNRLKEQEEALEQQIKPFETVYDMLVQNRLNKERQERMRQFQTLCQSELGEEVLRQLADLIEATTDEAALQEMAGMILAMGLVGRYPVKTQYLTERLLLAGCHCMNVCDLLQLNNLRERIEAQEHLDNLSRLYLLSENQVIDLQIAHAECQISGLTEQLSNGSLNIEEQRIIVQENLNIEEDALSLLKERQPELANLVGMLGQDRPEQGNLLALVNECLEQGPAKRLTEATDEELALLEWVGLDELVDKLWLSKEEAPSPLLYAMLQALQKLWEPMMTHGYYFVGYGLGPKSPLTGGLRQDDYSDFVRTLHGSERVDEVFPLFVNNLRQYANAYDWVQGFGEEPIAADTQTVVNTLKALAAGQYTDYLNLFDSPECYVRHGGPALQRYQVLTQLRQLIGLQQASRRVTNFKEEQEIQKRLDLASVVLRNVAYRALNQIKKESNSK